jgi:hypothetical protein
MLCTEGGDPKVPLHVCFGRRLTMNLGVVMDEGEVLPLLFGEPGFHLKSS